MVSKRKSSPVFSRTFAELLGFRKKYSLPVMITLKIREGLTFEQLYSTARNGNNSISKNSIKMALKELLKRGYIEKRAVMVDKKICLIHLLTEKGTDAVGNLVK